MVKIDEVTLPGSTWNKTQEGEPVFILCARDKTAPAVVRCWVAIARMLGVDRKKIDEALGLAMQMESWQAANGSKTPD